MKRIGRMTARAAAGVPHAAVRLLAAFAGAGTILGLAAPGWDGNWLWIGLADPPSWSSRLLLVAFAGGVLAHGRLGTGGRAAARLLAAAVAACCLRDAEVYYRLVAGGVVTSAFALPLSLPVAGLLAFWAVRPPRTGAAGPAPRPWARVAAGSALLALGLLAQIATFGATDYRRPADAIVVFGAGVYPNGAPSQALLDRTRTACLLYRQGLAPRLVFSGGRDPGAAVSEPEAMRAIARTMGVPEDAMVLDEGGANTRASVANAAVLARAHGWRRLLMVSHDYHLSRIKLLARRAGLASCTVPAEETRKLVRKPQFVLRELAAMVYHYVVSL